LPSSVIAQTYELEPWREGGRPDSVMETKCRAMALCDIVQ